MDKKTSNSTQCWGWTTSNFDHSPLTQSQSQIWWQVGSSLRSKKHLHLSFSIPITLPTSWHWLRPGSLQPILWPWLLSLTLHEKLARMLAQACLCPRNGASHIFYSLMSSFESHGVTVTSSITFLIVFPIHHLHPRKHHRKAGLLSFCFFFWFLLLFWPDQGCTREEMFWN